MMKLVSFFLMIFGLFSSDGFAHAARPSVTVYFFTGGSGSVLSEIGPDIRSFVQQRYAGYVVKGGVPGWGNSSVNEVCRNIARDSARGKVILVGHSFGSHAAVGAALCLARSNVRVDLLVTLDTIPNPESEGDGKTIPSNVVFNYNFFQKNDPALRGLDDNTRPDGRSRQGIYNRELSYWSLSPHSALDNRALNLVNWLVSATVEDRMNCVYIPGNDRGGRQSVTYSSGEINNSQFILQNFVPQQCR